MIAELSSSPSIDLASVISSFWVLWALVTFEILASHRAILHVGEQDSPVMGGVAASRNSLRKAEASSSSSCIRLGNNKICQTRWRRVLTFVCALDGMGLNRCTVYSVSDSANRTSQIPLNHPHIASTCITVSIPNHETQCHELLAFCCLHSTHALFLVPPEVPCRVRILRPRQ